MSVRDYAEKDYYATLGVSKTASPDEVKKAYRKLARTLHPDKNPGDAKAEARFKEVSEAYDVLSDPKRKAEYDEARALFASGAFRPGAGAGGGGPHFGGGFNVDDLGDLLGRAGAGGGAGGGGGLGDLFGGLFNRGGGSRQPRRGADLQGQVTLSFEDALRGVETSVRLPGAAPCATCHGSGAAPGTRPHVCPTCDGQGVITRNQGGFAFSEPCVTCRGRGSVVETPCPTCGGSGRQERVQRVRIPGGVTDGRKLRVRGRGAPGERGGPAGDLEVEVHVRPHAVFGRQGNDVTLRLPVTFPEAALGANIRIPTPLDGTVTVKVPPGTTSGRTLRVKGKGAHLRGGARGDMRVTVEVAVPQRLSAEAKASLQTFAEEAHDDPRAHLRSLVQPGATT